MQKEAKPLRFKIDRRGRKSFVGQMVDAIKEAISTGYYSDGDLLPSIDALMGFCIKYIPPVVFKKKWKAR